MKTIKTHLLLFILMFLGLFVLSISTSKPVLAANDDQFPIPMQNRIDAAATGDISSDNLIIDHYFETWAVAGSVAVVGSDKLNKVGALRSTSSAIAFILTNPPVEMGTYIADVMQNTGLASPAYAQGVGFSALSPILHIWKAFRNIAYFFIIIFFVITGFMIMFRRQIDHGTVVTLQMALPKIIATLILITFSYAIAGFVVDLIYLLIFLFTEVLDSFGVLTSASTAREVLLGNSVLRVGFKYLMGTGEIAGGSAQAVSNLITNALGIQWLDWLADALAYLIIAVAILIALFRTLFSLIGAYVGIIISVIFAPIQLLFNALPGSNTFSTWIKGLVANAMVFPAVAIMILIGASLVGVNHPSNDSLGVNIQPAATWRSGTGWVPPLVATQGFGTGTNAITGIIGLGIIMLLPEIANMIKKAMGVESEVGQMALAGMQRGPAAIVGGVKGVINTGVGALNYGRYAVEGWDVGKAFFKRGKGSRWGRAADELRSQRDPSRISTKASAPDIQGPVDDAVIKTEDKNSTNM